MVCRQKQAPRVTGSGQSLIQFFDVDKEGWGRLCVCSGATGWLTRRNSRHALRGAGKG